MAKTLSYDGHSAVSIIPKKESTGKQSKENDIKKNDKIDRNQNYKTDYGKEILFYYSTTEIKVITEDKIINFSNFISAVGGNLGLFIGFSFLGFFSCFYNLIEFLLK